MYAAIQGFSVLGLSITAASEPSPALT
uniref:Leucine-rich repeat extensin-like protein 4 n=1 Tax=Rhizophora mucronata TaxID=61149 RepID=A0A2P2QE93_RHIMU